MKAIKTSGDMSATNTKGPFTFYRGVEAHILERFSSGNSSRPVTQTNDRSDVRRVTIAALIGSLLLQYNHVVAPTFTPTFHQHTGVLISQIHQGQWEHEVAWLNGLRLQC